MIRNEQELMTAIRAAGYEIKPITGDGFLLRGKPLGRWQVRDLVGIFKTVRQAAEHLVERDPEFAKQLL